MRQASQKKTYRKAIVLQMGQRLREGLFILSIALAVFMYLSFSSYHATDPGWSSTGTGSKVLNLCGRAGAFIADIFLAIFGYIAYFLPPMLVLGTWVGMHYKEIFKLSDFLLKMTGLVLMMLSGCALTTLYLKTHSLHVSASSGGIFGDLVVMGLTYILNVMGSTVFLITALLCGITLFIGISWLVLIDLLGFHLLQVFSSLTAYIKVKLQGMKPWPKFFSVLRILKRPRVTSTPITAKNTSIRKEPMLIEQAPLSKIKIVEKRKIEKRNSDVKTSDLSITIAPGQVPPLSLLDAPTPSEGKAFSEVGFEELSHLVEQRLADFGVEVKVVAVHPGPVITRFELDLAPGIKVSKITGLAKDVARSLSVSSVRVVEVIPGKSVIGLELPNEHRDLVSLRDILESQRYAQSRSPVSLALGKDIAGHPVVVDLAKMPHLLVAGTTGSGKSVSVNAMLLSMLFKATPEQLRFIMIDPKMLELSVYEGIPHLLTPVITDMKDAANALRWCVAEMDRRYRLMSMVGVRNLAGFNAKILDAQKQGSPISTPEWLMSLGNHPPELQVLPMIVVVVDELADMMMVVGKKVEELVTRIAQKARAAGIHLILATQRPSVDVITGLIKANVPTRIAFQVSSRIDSRTILDQQGAEQLLGNGDMLYLPPGTGVPVRVHGAYVGDEEVHRVVAAWQTVAKPAYLQDVIETVAEGTGFSEDENNGETDPLYDEALRIVTESRRASISLVQRRLRIGYNRAARMMETMEAAGVVSSMDTNGSREVIAPPPVE